MIKEIEKRVPSGYPFLALLLALQIASAYAFSVAIGSRRVSWIVTAAIFNLVVFVCWFGLFMVNPNQSKVLQLFGQYTGTAKTPGLRWANPFYAKQAVSLRIRNFDSDKLKVNDKLGNPIEIAAVVVWKVVDSAEAVFEVDDYQNFVQIQSEAALRNLASQYPYDQHDDHELDVSLRSHTLKIADQLRVEIQERLEKAGVEVLEARISHLAYAPEIASAMLQRQQATAIIAARRKIVEGAVGMVETALEELSRKGVIDLDQERKAAMVSNLLVVLCGDHNAQPVINTGSLYQ